MNLNVSAEQPSSFPQSSPILDAYHVGRQLGRGCFAKVFKAIRKCDNKSVAIKVIEKKRLDDETSDLLHNELRILQAVSEHPGIVTLIDSHETDTHMFFIMEYVDGGPLLDRIVSRGSLSENDARILLRTLLLTLRFLSELGCVHRDIKPENILVDNHSKQWPIKLTDFGLSEKMQPDQLLTDAIGTPLFVAPEILKGNGYDCACDMWSLGVVMYIVLCGYPPFPIYDNPQMLTAAIVNGNYSFPVGEWTHVSVDAKTVVSAMLQVDPEKRLTPAQALAHPWIRMSQSTSDLPNSKLKSFNARRKLKAGVMAVRTTFGLRNILGPAGLRSRPINQETLIRDVERSRALIARVARSSGDSSDRVWEKGNRSRFIRENPALLSCRRSLILPVSVFAKVQVNNDARDPVGHRLDLSETLQSNHLLLSESEALQSKALAMAAEAAKESSNQEGTNPFMASIDSEFSDDFRSEKNPLNLELLDLASLGI
ncbi:Serine/threonine protein kinase [Gracilaria domingensis]|nr:Serine/threonine protein kinase [Gracilaria domingensis]